MNAEAFSFAPAPSRAAEASPEQWERFQAMSLQNEPNFVGRLAPDLGVRLAGFLRRHHPAKTAAHVAAVSRVPASTAERMLERRACPNLRTFGLMLEAYGPALLAELFDDPPHWLVGMAERAGRAADERG